MSLPTHQPQFVKFKQSTNVLGWRFDGVIDHIVIETLEKFTNGGDFRQLYFSPQRTSCVPEFSIATTTLRWENICDWEDEVLDEINTLEQFCKRLDDELESFGWRLPSEDELEVACGGELFPWGNEIPDGIPYRDLTSFSGHKMPNEYGLILNSNSYLVEIVRNQLKLGDGGESVCGAYPWPIPWLSFSPAYRVLPTVIEECLFEMLEDARIRPVLL